MQRLDRGILLAIFTLIGIGLVQVYSSSFIFAIESRGDGLFFFKRQLVFAAFALPFLFAVAVVPWRWIERWGFLLWIAAAIGIVLTFVPGFALKAGGSSRWLKMPGGNVFEPSELLKLAMPLLMATILAKRFEAFGRAKVFVQVLLVLLPLVLVLKQKDFGSFFICASVAFCLLFAHGLRWRYIVAGLTLALPIFKFQVWDVAYRRARIEAFLDPWSDPSGDGFQLIQSMLSFQSGGLTGAGLGQGQGKLFFLPEAHTDFTLAVLGEEMGFIGFMVVVAIFGYLVVRAFQIAMRSEETFPRALALGLGLTFGFQIFINVGVNLGLLPTKGLTLPFLSYGGSSLMMSCLLFGLLLNVERHEDGDASVGRQAARFAKSAASGRGGSRRRSRRRTKTSRFSRG